MEESAARGVSVSVDYDRRVNWAMQQNDVPVVKLCRVRNEGEAAVDDLVVRMTVANGVARPVEARILRIDPGSIWNLDSFDLDLDPEALRQQSEREETTLEVEVLSGDEVLVTESLPLEVLAWNEWGGLASLPEVLAAFVTPNHPAIDAVLARAGKHLEALTGDPTISGYQSRDPERARRLVEVIYRGVQDLGIAYVNPPASYEDEGQKVRLTDAILANKLGTCLDLAILFAACLEQAGLNPLLVLIKGHAFVGAWVLPESFSEPAMEDAARLRKRIKLEEIVAIEATAVTTRPHMDFVSAQSDAYRHLERTEDFRAAIDIAAARRVRIRPLPVRGEETVGAPGFVGDAPESGEVQPVVATPEVPLAPAQTPSPERPPEEPVTRLERWKRKLLDLTLRNRLINYRDIKRTIPLLCPDIAALEDALADGRSFGIASKPDFEGPRDLGVHRDRAREDAERLFLEGDMKRGRLHAKLTEEELDRRLVEIWRSSRRDLEETGAGTLYLAVGFLSWYEAESSGNERWAPILLVPLEMVRRSAREGFVVRRRDDDAMVNETLLEKLRSEFDIDRPELSEVPEDESGVDVALVLRRFREAIKDLDRWDVLEHASIGLFAFTKFLMWRDLKDRTDRLLENHVVRLLLEGEASQTDGEEGRFPDASTLDADRHPEDTLCPLDADSSQLVAIHAASDGRSFVLQGPPGTGKSQTITNLIAHALGHGKRVLFVAEKRAALEVVHGRLSRLGLAPFCLELHSNKASKREVLESIGEALLHRRVREPHGFSTRAEDLHAARGELNEYVAALHEPRPLGMTVFEVTSRLVGLRAAPRVRLGLRDVATRTSEDLVDLRERVDALATAAGAVGLVADHPLSAVGLEEWDARLSDRVGAARDALVGAVAQLVDLLSDVADGLGVADAPTVSETRFDALMSLVEMLLRAPSCRAKEPGYTPLTLLVKAPGWDAIKSTVEAWVARARRRDALRADVLARWDPDLLRLDLEDLVARWRSAEDAFAPVRWWRRRGVKKALSGVVVGGLPEPARLVDDLEKARTLRDESAAITEADPFAGKVDDDWDGIEACMAWAERFRGLLLQAEPDDLDAATAQTARLVALATDARDQVSEQAPLGRRLYELRPARDHYVETRTALRTLLNLDVSRAFGAADAPDVLGRVRASAIRLDEHKDGLRGWCHWRRMRAEASAAGVAAVAVALERGDLRADEATRAFDRSFYEEWLAEVTDANAPLRRFNGDEQDRRIRRFRRLDRGHLDNACDMVTARLSARVPDARGEASPTSEVGILQRQCKLKRRHMPVRQLIGRLPNLLPRLKPCFLMSPLSVAQYLDPDHPPFDLVVFDEASQIPPWDAVGAIARGERVVVVGDSRQLPPTTFFAKQDDEEEYDESELQEVESILDECEASGLPSLRLLWHYRSRHESLIAFSNWHYYENRLLTFPAAQHESDDLGVSLVKVEGTYDRSKTRTNRAEAETIVAEIVRRLTGAGEGAPTIGVVAFSQAQQSLIEDLLDAARRKNPDIERFFSDALDEPVFVKNLENVQGDERDVILFSVCYGPDAQGRVAMNFGPLNREGGERRLNVAVTRARRQVIVFSSMTSDAIDLSRTRALGARHLKAFLDYAERGPQAMAEAVTSVSSATESPFEEDVRQALVGRGWDVDCQVGCGGYRIDLGVRDPEVPGRYLLGIECDGATYHSARTARDRDRIRASVLQSLGWRLHRVWSTDWWHGRESEIERLEQALAEALKAAPPVTDHEPDDEAVSDAEAESGPDTDTVRRHPVDDESEGDADTVSGASGSAFASHAAAPMDEAPPDASSTADPGLGTEERVEPVAHPVLEPLAPRADGEDLYAAAAVPVIAAQVVSVVEAVAPVHVDRIVRHVGAAWGQGRLTSKLRDHVLGTLASVPEDRRPVVAGDFLWAADQEPDTYAGMRPPSEGDPDAREAEEIPEVEVANAAKYILSGLVSVPREDLARECARFFGFKRMGTRVQSIMEAGIDRMVARGDAIREGDRITQP